MINAEMVDPLNTPRDELDRMARENAARILALEHALQAEETQLASLQTSPRTKKDARLVAIRAAAAAASAAYESHRAVKVQKPASPKSPARKCAAKATNAQKHRPQPSPNGLIFDFDRGTAVPSSSLRPRREMASHGSHWTQAERDRFDAAVLMHGPRDWPQIIAAVGTRTEKQVRAYALRLRRRNSQSSAASAFHALSVPTLLTGDTRVATSAPNAPHSGLDEHERLLSGQQPSAASGSSAVDAGIPQPVVSSSSLSDSDSDLNTKSAAVSPPVDTDVDVIAQSCSDFPLGLDVDALQMFSSMDSNELRVVTSPVNNELGPSSFEWPAVPLCNDPCDVPMDLADSFLLGEHA